MSARKLARSALIRGLTALRADAAARRLNARADGGPAVRIALMHGMRAADEPRLRDQLAWVARHFRLIDFAEFKRLWTEPAAACDTRPLAMFTFDDGLLSTYELAAPLLEEFGTRGLFFVNPGFASLEGDSARAFYSERLHGSPEQDFRPMNPGHIRDLVERGHAIGNHTMSHSRLSRIDPSEYGREILDAADLLEQWTGGPVESFAWTYRADEIAPAAYAVAVQRHPFVFTPCPGLARRRTTPAQLVWRTNVEASTPPADYRFLYSGLADPVWAGTRRRLCATLLA